MRETCAGISQGKRREGRSARSRGRRRRNKINNRKKQIEKEKKFCTVRSLLVTELEAARGIYRGEVHESLTFGFVEGGATASEGRCRYPFWKNPNTSSGIGGHSRDRGGAWMIHSKGRLVG